MKGCTELVGLLADFVEHQLPAEVHEALQKHLAACPRCLCQVKTYESTVALLKTIKDDELPPELRCTLKAFISRRWDN